MSYYHIKKVFFSFFFPPTYLAVLIDAFARPSETALRETLIWEENVR